jgi:MFS family permease
LNSLISRCALPERQGEVMGVAQSVGALSRVLGPIVAGALFSGLGRNSPFFWGAMLVALALLTGWRLSNRLGPAEPGVTPRPQPRGPAE